MTNLIPQERTPQIQRADGAASTRLAQYLLARLPSLHANSDDSDEAMRAASAYMNALEPQDPVEEVIAAKMMAVFETSMTCLSRAATAGDKLGVRDIELRHAEKFLNLHSKLLELFEKRRHRLKIVRRFPDQALVVPVPQW
ncbi:MAG: hypothetical protein H0W71_08040 [Sphingomonas sp.]|nr:hypothetical protein [Sphingomonas sp.]